MNAAELRSTLALANAFKEGDLLVGGTRDDRLREEARRALLHLRVRDIRRVSLIEDGVTDALERTRDRTTDGDLDQLTITALKDHLLSDDGPSWAKAHRDALPSEVVAAIAKVMSEEELGRLSRQVFHPLPGGIGAPLHFGSRIQPNSPGDDEEEIVFSILDGLSHGCGDVIIGLNPAADELDTIVHLERLLEQVVRRLRLPTRFCVLTDIVKQQQAAARTRIDVGFQSLAGTTSALMGMVGLDVNGVLDVARSFDGLYFETGQGSAVTNGTAEGVDMVTLEARAYGVARHIRNHTGAWMIVNDVAGFIGPEVFRTTAQLERACLEDLVMAKLHGITMGLDVCATFHMGIRPMELRAVTERVVAHGGPAYLMAVAGNADPMLGYLTTSFSEHPVLRRMNDRHATAAMRERLSELPSDVVRLYAEYVKAGGDERTLSQLEEDGRRKLSDLQDRGFDLGGDEDSSRARVERLYEHARRALYASMQTAVIQEACPTRLSVQTCATDRDHFLVHPPAGERIRRDDVPAVQRLSESPGKRAQIVVSDGLNANAINEHLRALLPRLRRLLSNAGIEPAETVVVVHHGRVRAGYHIAQMIDPELLIHLIGERPGTGLNTLSAYLTYGRDTAGATRWNPQLDHSVTTAVCGIHPRGKPLEAAAVEIARLLQRMTEQRCSGVSLR